MGRGVAGAQGFEISPGEAPVQLEWGGWGQGRGRTQICLVVLEGG